MPTATQSSRPLLSRCLNSWPPASSCSAPESRKPSRSSTRKQRGLWRTSKPPAAWNRRAQPSGGGVAKHEKARPRFLAQLFHILHRSHGRLAIPVHNSPDVFCSELQQRQEEAAG